MIDMDKEGRDIDYIIPGTWATTLTALPDMELAEGMYRAYHNYLKSYCNQRPDRLKASAMVLGADIEWSLEELKWLVNEQWLAGVRIMLPLDIPIDDPKPDPPVAFIGDAGLHFATPTPSPHPMSRLHGPGLRRNFPTVGRPGLLSELLGGAGRRRPCRY